MGIREIFLSLCLFPVFLCGVIIESDKMDAFVPYVDEDTWVFFDVDNTLIEPCQQLGSTQWREHVCNKALSLGHSKEEAEVILDQFWYFVQFFIPVKLVDPSASELLKGLHVPSFALTAREPIEAGHTQRQLASVELSFLSSERVVLRADFPSLFQNGVIYCGNNTKAEALTAFFDWAGYLPKKVIFIDDRLGQVEALEKMLLAKGIEFVGIRFGGADRRVEAFDGDIADVQFSYLPRIISDEEAKNLLSKETGFVSLFEREE